MSDLKEQAKKIIAKGKALGDVELINMGLDMLDGVDTSVADEYFHKDLLDEKIQLAKTPLVDRIPSIIPTPSQRQHMGVAASKIDITDQFRVKKESVISAKYGKKVSVLVGERNNKFIDDGNDSSDLKGKTPDFKPTERNRKVKKVAATCQVCGKVEHVNEIFTVGREFYRCESCVLKGKS